ncbi:hypothetical protein L9F63_017555, partial [Diploptera punctata]
KNVMTDHRDLHQTFDTQSRNRLPYKATELLKTVPPREGDEKSTVDVRRHTQKKPELYVKKD